ncbi:MAG: carbon monoxide dehydrogenase subunit G [Spirosomataceae bacterium]
MQLSGSHTLNASISKVWDMLMDTDTLARIVPGISRLEQTEGYQYKAIAEIKLGPVNGSFSGSLSLDNIKIHEGYTLHIKQNSKIGNADAAVTIGLRPLSDSQTELSFDGDAKLSGLLARTGQRVLSGVASSLTSQFFQNFEVELTK